MQKINKNRKEIKSMLKFMRKKRDGHKRCMKKKTKKGKIDHIPERNMRRSHGKRSSNKFHQIFHPLAHLGQVA
jgi:hypothetical protein